MRELAARVFSLLLWVVAIEETLVRG